MVNDAASPALRYHPIRHDPKGADAYQEISVLSLVPKMMPLSAQPQRENTRFWTPAEDWGDVLSVRQWE